MQTKLFQSAGMRIVPIALVTRILTDTGVQMFYPFAPILASGLNISAVQFGYLISLRSMMGLFSPLFGEWADRAGYRVVLLTSLMIVAIGAITIGASPSLPLTVLGVVLFGIGGAAFVPTLQAFSSQILTDSERARGMGIIEYGWALSSIVGLFAVGRLIEVASWRAPFFVLGACLMAVWPIFGRIIPATSTPNNDTDLRTFFVIKQNKRGAWGMIITVALIAFSAMHTFVAHGIWLEDAFALGAVQLGTVALAMGVVDLAGSGAVSTLLDKFGRRRSLMLASIATSIAFVALLFLSSGQFLVVMASLLMVRFLFEYCIVAGMIVLSEQSPMQRAKVLTISGAISTLGIALAGITGPTAYVRWGAPGLALPSAIGYLLVFVAVRMALKPEHVEA